MNKKNNTYNYGKVSIISPVYNGENYISSFLLAISNQSYNNFEWIIIDDGSKDNTNSIIHEYINNHPMDNIILIKQENKGVSSARNYGLKSATGDFIMFADADDRPHSNFVSEYARILAESQSDIAIFGLNLMNTDGTSSGEVIYPDTKAPNEVAIKKLLNQNSYGYLFSTITKRSIWADKMLNSDLYFLEDEEILIRLFLDSTNVLFSSEIFYDYIQRETSVVHSLSLDDYKNAYESTLVMKNDIIDSNLSNLENIANARVLGALVPLIILSLRDKEYELTDYYIKKYLTLYPKTAISGFRGLRRRILKVLFQLKLNELVLFIYRNVVF